jgi:NADH:ubiquinone reductase (H+-translocating)
MKHIVVVGGGFAGLMALKRLIKSRHKLTLINDKEDFLFTPRLTELLNGSVSPKIVIKPIKEIFGDRVKFIKGKASKIDFEKSAVEVGNDAVNYDYLVLAQGAETNFFGSENLERNTIDYKDYVSVLRIKEKIVGNLGTYSKSGKEEDLTFVVVGGGLTGIELMCSLKETVIKEMKEFAIDAEPKFLLVQGSDKIVPQLGEKLRSRIEAYLRKNSVNMLTGTKAKDVAGNVLIANDGKIRASTIVWAAGIKANKIESDPELEFGRGGAIRTDSKLKLPRYDNVYVAGDTALFAENGKPLAPTAQAAFQEGASIGKNILRRIAGRSEKDFHYSHKGTLIVLGKGYGIFNYKSVTIAGKLSYLLRDLIYRYRFWQLT